MEGGMDPSLITRPIGMRTSYTLVYSPSRFHYIRMHLPTRPRMHTRAYTRVTYIRQLFLEQFWQADMWTAFRMQ